MVLTNRFEKAFSLASDLHKEQTRKGTDIPYVSHLMGVTALVLENGGNEDQAIAALLHDAVEDAGGLPTLNRIREEFGAAVATIVDDCTDSYETPKPPWAERKRAYVAGIAKKSDASLLVSCADKLHNARCILADYREEGEAFWTRFNAGRSDVLWYYRSLADAFSKRGPGKLAAELDRVVSELEAMD